MSYVSDLISKTLNPIDVATKYGLQTDRSGRCKCPFHGSNSKTMAIYNKAGGKYFCFSCNASGDSIGLAKQLLGVDYNEAVKILAKDFNLNVFENGEAEKDWKTYQIKKVVAEHNEKFKPTAEYDRLLDQHRKYHNILKDKPESWESMSDEFVEALQNIDQVNARIEAIEYQMYGKEG